MRLRFLSLLVPLLLAAPPARAAFDGKFARELDLVLSSDSLEGRKTGQPGGRKAEAWAASLLREWGLRPGVGDTSYFQNYDFLTTQVVGPPELDYLGAPPGDIHYAYGNDFVAALYSGSGEVTGDVVFLGYGISEPAKDHDDYAGVDVSGKIVMFFRGAPHLGHWEEERQTGYKTRTAKRHGAVGAIVCDNESPILGTLQAKFFEADFPAVAVAARVSRDLLVGTGHALSDLRAAVGKDQPCSFDLGHRLHLKVKSDVLNPGQGRNVVARIPGTDAAMRRECVVVGAHLDHMGRDGIGRIYPGADDNGSGASTVLEMAHALSRGSWRPKRTVYLVLFTGEEQGLVGSTYFAEHPPAESIAVMLNMDMVGVGDPVPNLSGVDRFPELARLARALLPDSTRARSDLSAISPNSDEFPFADRGIPSVFSVTHGEHPDYHTPGDQGWKIREEVLEAVGQHEMRLLRAVADTGAFRVDGVRIARMLSRMGRPVARAHWDEARHGLREAAARGAGIVLLSLPPADPLQMDLRISRLKKEFAVDTSLYRLALSADDLDGAGGQGRVSVILECRISTFDLEDTTLTGFLFREGARLVEPDGPPTPSEARHISAVGLILDQTELKRPLAADVPSVYLGRAPAGATHAFEWVEPRAARVPDAHEGFLFPGEPIQAAQRLIQEGWNRQAILNYFSGNFSAFWREGS